MKHVVIIVWKDQTEVIYHDSMEEAAVTLSMRAPGSLTSFIGTVHEARDGVLLPQTREAEQLSFNFPKRVQL